MTVYSGSATRARSGREQVDDFRRRRLLTAMATVADENGVEAATVTRVITLARISRRTFYELFDSRSDCLLAAIERAVALAHARAMEEWATQGDWLSRVRGALYALLELFDHEPQLARLCVVYSNTAEPTIAARRSVIVGQLASALDGGRQSTRNSPPRLTAEALVGGALSVIQAQLVKPRPGKLVDLTNPLMSLISYPYRGAGAARRELHRRPRPASRSHEQARNGSSSDGRNDIKDFRPPPNIRMTYRTVRVLAAIAAQPGLSNRQAGERADVADQGQISKLLSRLARVGLVENVGPGQPRGGANAWRLTAEGQHLTGSIDRDLLSLSR
jgi:AcrR family transcriptional regulator